MKPPTNYTLMQKVFWLRKNEEAIKKMNKQLTNNFNKKQQND